MKYWILKGRPADNDWQEMLQPGALAVWHTAKPPATWKASDRFFCWESSPKLRIVGLAELRVPRVKLTDSGETLFRVKYLTRVLGSKPTISELREIPIIRTASFLKSGPATTIQVLNQQQAEILLRLIRSRNPGLDVWPDVESDHLGPIPDAELAAVSLEGRKKLIMHFIRERDRRLIEQKKSEVLRKVGHLSCEACSFNFEHVYGSRGRDYCEVHHLLPLSETDSTTETRLEDLAVLCSNCHRMLHINPRIEIEQLRNLLRRQGMMAGIGGNV